MDRLSNMLFNHQKFEPLVHELRNFNRHFLQSSAAEEISKLVEDIDQYDTLPFNTHLFRARGCNSADCKKLNLKLWGERYGVMFSPLCPPIVENPGDFAGFPLPEDSGAPPIEKCGENRAGGKGIRRLYVAENPRTAIAEVRPFLQSIVNIAEFELTYNDILILDLTNHSHKENGYLRTLIDRMFATPCSEPSDSECYSFTQWFADLVADFGIKMHQKDSSRLEIRGIKYSSAMDLDGKNIVLFGSPKGVPSYEDIDAETFGVKVIKTEVYFIDNVKYNIRQVKSERDDVFQLESGNC
jgi:hypothetical protein